MNRKKELAVEYEGTEFDIRSSLMALDVRAMSFIQNFRPSNVFLHTCLINFA